MLEQSRKKVVVGVKAVPEADELKADRRSQIGSRGRC